MYKFFGVIICVCLFTGAGCTSPTPEPITPQTTQDTPSPALPDRYSSFSLEEFSSVIPQDWALDESQRDSNRAIFLFEKSANGQPSLRSISFTVFPLPTPAPTLGDLLVESRKELEKNGAVISAADIISTEDRTYLRTDFSLTHQGVDYYSSQSTVIGTKHLLLITETTTNLPLRGTTPLPEIISFLWIK